MIQSVPPAVESDGPPLTIVIPLGGIGARFTRDGYTSRPKPFVRVLGKEILIWIIESLCMREQDALVIVYNPAFANIKVCMENLVLAKCVNRIQVVELPGETRGAAETVLLGLQEMAADIRERPIMLCDGDTFCTADIVSMYRGVAGRGRNGSFYFNDFQPMPLYSYIRVEESTGTIVEILEKVKISDMANSGCYCFAKGDVLQTYCQRVLDEAVVQGKLPDTPNGELYTSAVIKAMIADGHAFEAIRIEKQDMQVLGTPAQVVEFCGRWAPQPVLRFVFDLDMALMAPAHPSARSAIERPPVGHVVDYLQQVHRQGHTVVVVATLAAAGIAEEWLHRHAVPFSVLQIEESVDFLISSRAVDPFQGGDALALARQTGIYEIMDPASKNGTAGRDLVFIVPRVPAGISEAESKARCSGLAWGFVAGLFVAAGAFVFWRRT